MRNEVETLFTARPVHGGVILEQIKFFFVAGVPGDFEEMLCIEDEDGLLSVFEGVENRGAKALPIAAGQFIAEGNLQRGGSGSFCGRRWRSTRG